MMPLLFMFINAFRAWSNEQMLSLLLTMDKDPQAGHRPVQPVQVLLDPQHLAARQPDQLRRAHRRAVLADLRPDQEHHGG